MGEHNVVAHSLLAVFLFVLNTIIFGGAGTWSAILGVTVGMAGVYIVGGSGSISQAAAGAEQILGVVMAIIVNIVIYYLLAAVILFIFNIFFGKK